MAEIEVPRRSGTQAGAPWSRAESLSNRDTFQVCLPQRCDFVQPLQLDAGIGRGELPFGFSMILVATVLPSCDFLDQSLFVWNTPIETLGGQHTKFGFRHVEPTSVLRRVVPLEPLDEPAGLLGGKGFVE